MKRIFPSKMAFRKSLLAQSLAFALGAQAVTGLAYANTDQQQQLPTGAFITPLAQTGAVQQELNPNLSDYPDFVAGGAVVSRLNPAGTTLAVLCAGQNNLYKADGSFDFSNQYIFLYDVSGDNKKQPKLMKVVKQRNAHVGLVWSKDGNAFYATGGRDDTVYKYSKDGDLLNTIALGHGNKGVGLGVLPNASGLAISDDGKTLVVANNYNDSISVIDTATNTVRFEHDLRPFFANNEGNDGAAGGTYPFAVVIKDNNTAYVSASRDREVVVVDLSSATEGKLITRIQLHGNPLGMTLNAAEKKLYVAQDNSDEVAVIDTDSNSVVTNIDTRGPKDIVEQLNHDAQDEGGRYTGASPFSVKLSPNGAFLYAVNDGANSVAVIALNGEHANKVIGLIPTAYAPRDISFSSDGKWMYIINGKSITGPNPGHLFGNTAHMTSSTYPDGVIMDNGKPVAAVKTSAYPLGDGCDANCQGDNNTAHNVSRGTNQYQFQLEHSSLVSAPVPSMGMLRQLTRQVAQNNFYTEVEDEHSKHVMEFMHEKIQHVIYVVKENRTFDQILGDLDNGANADARLNVFGEAITPNLHALARNFVTLDNFMDPGDGSMDGWSWSMQGRVTSTEGLTQQLNYGGHGLSYDSEGGNRNAPVNWESVADRDAAVGPAGTTAYTDAATAANLPGGVDNLLAGARNHASTDAPFGEEDGFIWNAVLEAGKTVRNYGFLVRNFGDRVEDPHGNAVVQVGPLDPSLARKDFNDANDSLPAGSTDVYFRGYDQAYPDMWRYGEWKREFDMYVENGKLPNLTLLRVSHDHMGSFGSAKAAVNTPETQQADNDLAVGKIVEAIANSPYAKNTLIVVIEDDCQDGPDHVDSHRTTTYVVGPYVKKNQIISKFYTQVNVLRTIEDILGAPHINLNTARQQPMADLFDITASADWTYKAVASTVLLTTNLDLGNVVMAKGPLIKPKHDAIYWAKATSHFDFSDADLVNPSAYNRVLWTGLMEGKAYPAIHTAF